jgi:hypothetical protein
VTNGVCINRHNSHDGEIVSNIKYTKELLLPIVKSSTSVSSVCRALGLNPRHSTERIGKAIKRCGINTDHFTWHTSGHIISDRDIFREGSSFTRTTRYRLKEHKTYCCSLCGISKWKGEDLILDTDHINRDRSDNRLSNLQFLCPNCHRLKHKNGR